MTLSVVIQVAFFPGGKRLATVSQDEIRIWKVVPPQARVAPAVLTLPDTR